MKRDAISLLKRVPIIVVILLNTVALFAYLNFKSTERLSAQVGSAVYNEESPQPTFELQQPMTTAPPDVQTTTKSDKKFEESHILAQASPLQPKFNDTLVVKNSPQIMMLTRQETSKGSSTLFTQKTSLQTKAEEESNETEFQRTAHTQTNVSEIQSTAVSNALKNIDKCMHGSNLSSADLVEVARQNAQLFMEEYGKIISPDYLSNYSNHCWETDYSVSISRLKLKVQLGKSTFTRVVGGLWFEYNMRTEIEKYKEGYHSSMICLPNIYLLGFEKSGSTFFWCVLSKILNHPTGTRIQADKEPYFWTPFSYKPSLPDPGKLAAFYVPMFLRASDPKLSTEKRKDLTLIDGSPNTVLEWPRFSDTEPDLANYCLLPSALPELFPESKYMVIMRNPVRMLYSAFWWSFYQCNSHDTLSEQKKFNQNKGPEVFHLQASEKISQFLKCVNSHPSVQSESKCDLWEQSKHNYSSCIKERVHLLAECVANITNKRDFLEAVIHRGIYYVHVRKWLQTVPRERIFFTTIEQLSSDTYSTAKEVYKFLKGNSKFKTTEEGMKHITKSCTNNPNAINYKKAELAMKNSTRAMLEKFFVPFNRMLSDLLEDEQFLWQK